MRICVLVKAVPDASRRVDPGTGLLDRAGEGGLNTADRYAVEAALQLREAGMVTVSEVVAVTMGPRAADRALRRALAMGCDRGIHLCDPLLGGSDAVATGRALARVIEREMPGLALLGESSSDGGCGLMAAVVAECLGLPVVSGARSLKVADSEVTAEQISEFGRLTVAVKTPAVISVATDANTPRYASLKETMQTRSRPVEVLSCVDIGLAADEVGAAGAAVNCGAWSEPVPRTAGRVLEPASVDEAVDGIIGWLRERDIR